MPTPDLPPRLLLPPKQEIVRAARLPRTPAEARGIETKTGMLPGVVPVMCFPTSNPKVATYRDNGNSESDLTTYSFANMNIGPPTADRRVHVFAFSGNSTAGASSVTVGGISATINLSCGGGSFDSGVIATALVPTGATANVVITWAAGQTRCFAMVWSSTGLPSNDALDTDFTDLDNSARSLTNSVADGFAIAASFTNGGSGSVDWTGVIERLDHVVGGSINQSGGDGPTAGPNHQVVCNWSSAVFPLMMCACW